MLIVAGANYPRTSNTLAISETRIRFVTFSDSGKLETVKRNWSVVVFPVFWSRSLQQRWEGLHEVPAALVGWFRVQILHSNSISGVGIRRARRDLEVGSVA